MSEGVKGKKSTRQGVREYKGMGLKANDEEGRIVCG